MTKIVAFAGKRGAGKDTAGDVLTREFGFEKLGLADPMKRFVGEVFGMSWDQLFGPSENRERVDERWGRSPRHLLQTLGTDWGREMGHPDVWIRYLVRKADEIVESGRAKGIVVTDVRFPNELSVLRQAGAKLVLVRRAEASSRSDVASLHASETSLDELPPTSYHAVLGNDGTKAEFQQKVRELLSRW